MLKTRIITAAILIALLLLVVFWLPPVATLAAVTALALAGAWEWAGFMRLPQGRLPRLAYVAGIAICLPLAQALMQSASGRLWLLAAATAWWLVALLWVMLAPQRVALWSTGLAGLLTLVPTWAAMVYLRRELPDGAQWMLFVMLLVWVADIGAYFAGRGFGRHKLAPTVSPGKTWEGVAGAVVASCVLAGLGSHWFRVPLLPFLPLCLAAVAFSIVGDLTESLFKRFAGLKDSGTLLPGHGGVMDRIDSLCSAAPVLLLGLLTCGVVP